MGPLASQPSGQGSGPLPAQTDTVLLTDTVLSLVSPTPSSPPHPLAPCAPNPAHALQISHFQPRAS